MTDTEERAEFMTGAYNFIEQNTATDNDEKILKAQAKYYAKSLESVDDESLISLGSGTKALMEAIQDCDMDLGQISDSLFSFEIIRTQVILGEIAARGLTDSPELQGDWSTVDIDSES